MTCRLSLGKLYKIGILNLGSMAELQDNPEIVCCFTVVHFLWKKVHSFHQILKRLRTFTQFSL